MNKLNILCIGGDARFIYLCRHLGYRHNVYAFRTQAPPEGAVMLKSLSDMDVKADVLVLPMMNSRTDSNGRIGIPCGDDAVYIDEIIPLLKDNAVITGGLLDEGTAALFTSFGYEPEDYFKRRELIIKNCIPTAEGALGIAMQERNETVFGSRVIITGFGNVSKAAAKLFKACGAEVTCAVRRSDAAAEARAFGYGAADISGLKDCISAFDIIINTVPALVINKEAVANIRKGSLIIDLASKPGGVDFAAAKEAGIKCVHALALPGKVAPVTAGRYIAETVENIISERRG